MLYIKGLSEKVSKMLKHDNDNLKIAFRNHNNNNLFTKLKDKTVDLIKTNVIYAIPCTTNNCKAIYTGLTTTNLKTRISNHNSCWGSNLVS
jgi:hypothetical protein